MVNLIKTERLKIKKGKYGLLNSEIITKRVCKFPYYKNKEYLTEENSCFIILTKILNECLCRHCKFPNEHHFLGLTGALT